MHSLVIFASGRGTNAAAIIDYFKTNGKAKVALIVSNKPDAGVLDIARTEQIPFLIIDRNTFKDTLIIEQVQDYKPSLIVLAGFLWKMPDHFVQAFPDKIVNIHPALLPLYGGKGMYGHHVHNAVLSANDAESGITVHYVNEVYDSGNIILQARCEVKGTDTADTLAKRIHALEHFYYPRALDFLLGQINDTI
ncbi:MAG: phosphoribosylglycinamide formyltransferase [Bacteroidetes bacterium]|nr:phosphoribosylglycinamide formyltransferase [Bacteroidota bacterium]